MKIHILAFIIGIISGMAILLKWPEIVFNPVMVDERCQMHMEHYNELLLQLDKEN